MNNRGGVLSWHMNRVVTKVMKRIMYRLFSLFPSRQKLKACSDIIFLTSFGMCFPLIFYRNKKIEQVFEKNFWQRFYKLWCELLTLSPTTDCANQWVTTTWLRTTHPPHFQKEQLFLFPYFWPIGLLVSQLSFLNSKFLSICSMRNKEVIGTIGECFALLF